MQFIHIPKTAGTALKARLCLSCHHERQSFYEDEKYLSKNESWHVEDSPWKATQIVKLINENDYELDITTIGTVCEVGCGAGEVLVQLS